MVDWHMQSVGEPGFIFYGETERETERNKKKLAKKVGQKQNKIVVQSPSLLVVFTVYTRVPGGFLVRNP